MPRSKRKITGKRSAYNFFVQGVAESVKKGGSHIKLEHLTQHCSARWKEMTDSEKRPFVNLAEDDKIRYEDAVANDSTHASPQQTPKKKRTKAKAKKDPNAPKAAMTSYNFFAKEMYAGVKEDNPGSSFAERSKIIGTLWKHATPNQKLRFVQLADSEKARYKAEMASYKATGVAGGSSSANLVLFNDFGDDSDEQGDDSYANFEDLLY